MSTIEDLFSPLRQQGRVAAKTAIGVVNTGIDVTNLFMELDEQFKPIDVDKDIFEDSVRTAANTIARATNPERGKQAQTLLSALTRAPQGATEGFAEDTAVFLLGFLGGKKIIQAGLGGATKAAQASRVAKYGTDLGAGAISAFTLEDPETDRLVNFIPKQHRGAFLDYLAYDPNADEGRLEGRFKNALVDMGLGVLADGAFGLIARSFKQTRRAIHLEAAGDPEAAARLAKDILGESQPPPLPTRTPFVDLSSEAFEGSSKTVDGPPPLPKARATSAEEEADAVEAYLRIAARDGGDMADATFKALNHTHFDLRDADGTVYLANTILERVQKHLDNAEVQTWDQLYEASNTIATKEQLKSFEAISQMIGGTVADLKKASPVVHLIRRMYAESADEIVKLQTKYLTASKEAQVAIRQEIADRFITHMTLTEGISQLGTGAGRLLRSFGAKAQGDLGAFKDVTEDLIRGKGVKEATERMSKRKPKVNPTGPPKEIIKDAAKEVDRLTKELDKLRKNFGDDSKLPKDKKPKVDPKDIKDLKDRIKFYKTAQTDAKRLSKLEARLEALNKLSARGTRLDLEVGTGKLKPPPLPKGPQETALRKEIADLRASMKKRLEAMDAKAPKTLEDRIYDALSENSAEGVARAVKEATDNELKDLMRIIEGLDMKDAKAWIKGQQTESGKVKKILQLFRKIKFMNMLSGIPTFVTNNLSNTASILFRKGFEDIIASAIPSRAPDRMRLMGEIRGMRSLVQQPIELLGSLFKGAADAHKSGEPLGETLGKLAVDDTTRWREEGMALGLLVNSDSTAARLINKYGKIAHAMSFGHMTVGDQFAKQGIFASEITGIAHSTGVTRGLKGMELAQFEKTMVEQSIFLARKGKEGGKHIVDSLKAAGQSTEDAVRHLQTVADMVEQGRNAAKEGTFQDEISSETLKAIEKALNKDNAGMHLFKTLVVPFYRTPVKIVEFALERTPILQVLSRKYRADLFGHNGTRAKQRAVAKFITGSVMYSGAFMLAQNNYITGKHRPEERDALLQAGIPEYSIRIPNTDKWISMTRLDPFAMFLGITADMNKLVEDNKLDGGTALAATLSALSSNVLNKTFMKGLSDFLKAINSPAEFGAYYADSQVRSIVAPLSSFQRSFEKVWNANSEEYRKQKPEPAFGELRDWLDILLGDTGLTGTREYDMTDAIGNKIERGPLWSELTGLRQQETTDSPAMRELALHKRFPQNRELSLATGFKMSSTEFQDFKKILGTDVKLKERLDRIVSTQKYKRASNANQAKMLDKVIRDARKLAKATLLRQNPELKQQVVEHKRQRLLGSLIAAEASSGIPSIDKILDTRRETYDRDE